MSSLQLEFPELGEWEFLAAPTPQGYWKDIYTQTSFKNSSQYVSFLLLVIQWQRTKEDTNQMQLEVLGRWHGNQIPNVIVPFIFFNKQGFLSFSIPISIRPWLEFQRWLVWLRSWQGRRTDVCKVFANLRSQRTRRAWLHFCEILCNDKIKVLCLQQILNTLFRLSNTMMGDNFSESH